MEISAKELRGRPSQIIEHARRGTEIIITLRGKKTAKLIPYKNNIKKTDEQTDEIFGMWLDQSGTTTAGGNISVEEQVRILRKGRKR